MQAPLLPELILALGDYLQVTDILALASLNKASARDYTKHEIIRMLAGVNVFSLMPYPLLFQALYKPAELVANFNSCIVMVQHWLLGEGQSVEDSLIWLLGYSATYMHPDTSPSYVLDDLFINPWVQKSGCAAAILNNALWMDASTQYSSIIDVFVYSDKYGTRIVKPLPHEFKDTVDSTILSSGIYECLLRSTEDTRYIYEHTLRHKGIIMADGFYDRDTFHNWVEIESTCDLPFERVIKDPVWPDSAITEVIAEAQQYRNFTKQQKLLTLEYRPWLLKYTTLTKKEVVVITYPAYIPVLANFNIADRQYIVHNTSLLEVVEEIVRQTAAFDLADLRLDRTYDKIGVGLAKYRVLHSEQVYIVPDQDFEVVKVLLTAENCTILGLDVYAYPADYNFLRLLKSKGLGRPACQRHSQNIRHDFIDRYISLLWHT
jgi:hypothetical protein